MMISDRHKELRGPQTGVYVDMFDIEYPVFEQSKVYYVTNIGQSREEILEFLRDNDIEILEEKSMFKYICIAIQNEPTKIYLSEILKREFDCSLQWEGI